MARWRQNIGGNFILEYDEFYISFRPHNTGMLDGTFMDTDKVEGETALSAKNDTQYFILNGDHREAYEALGDDYAACLEYFTTQGHLKSKWSN